MDQNIYTFSSDRALDDRRTVIADLLRHWSLRSYLYQGQRRTTHYALYTGLKDCAARTGT